jgi:hypothetical protein
MRTLEIKTLCPGKSGYEVEAVSPSDLQIKVLALVIPQIDKDAFNIALALGAQVKREISAQLQEALRQAQVHLLPRGRETRSVAISTDTLR